MRQYELVVVFSPILSDEDKTSARDRIKQLITNGDGEITQEEDWGMRRLAYPIRKGSQTFLEGSYFLTRFSTDTVAPRELEPQLNLGENILRYLLVNADSVNITAPTTADFTPREPGPRRFDQRRGPGGPFRGPPPPPGGPPGAPPAARAAAPGETSTAAPSAGPATVESPTAPPEDPTAQPATAESPTTPAEDPTAQSATVESPTAPPEDPTAQPATAKSPTTPAEDPTAQSATAESPTTPAEDPTAQSATAESPAAPDEASAATPDAQAAAAEAPAAPEAEAPASDEPGPDKNAEE